MIPSVYVELRERLDREPLGFPATESGLELRILRRLFTEEEAGTYLGLGTALEEPAALARRVGRDAARVAEALERMAEKGLVLRARDGDAREYAALPFVLGSFEFWLRNRDREFARLFDDFFREAFGARGIVVEQPIRIVPVSKSIGDPPGEDLHEDARSIVMGKDVIAVSRCICRVQQKILDRGCDQPLEVCLEFGRRARAAVDGGMGRLVTTEEALALLDACERAGLVAQPFTIGDSGALCNCCGDCCAILRAIQLDPAPARRVSADYRAAVDPEACSACGTCFERCQMGAVRMGAADAAEVDRDRCIGCGLCVTTCPGQAISLRKKPGPERGAAAAAGGDYLMQLFRHEVRDFIREAGRPA